MVTSPVAPAVTPTTYEPVIGLEVHVQLLTRTKIFCGCSTQFGNPPNTNVCSVCLGLPGALPVLNRQAVEYAVLAAMALNCQIRENSIFARKNYFYPDLPKGYQISQYDKPLAEHGYIEVQILNAENISIQKPLTAKVAKEGREGRKEEQPPIRKKIGITR